MKLIYIANARIPTQKAHGKQIMKTCEALSAAGVDLELWTAGRLQSQDLAGRDPFEFYNISRRFMVKWLPTIDLLQVTDRWPKVLDSLSYLIQEYSFIIGLLFCDFTGAIVYTRWAAVAWTVKFFKRVPVYYEAHNVPGQGIKRDIYIFFCRKLNGVLPISSGLAKVFREAGLKHLMVVFSAVDLKEYINADPGKIRAKLGLKTGEKVCLYLGSMQAGKGVVTYVRAAGLLEPSNIRCYLIGNYQTQEGQRARQIVLESGAKNITFLGFIEPRETPDYLKAADVLVLPGSARVGYTRDFTSPMKLFEYLACGVPIVATKTPANLEVLNEKNSVLVEPDDEFSLARGVKRVLADKTLAEVIHRQALSDAKKYSWEGRAKKITFFLNLR